MRTHPRVPYEDEGLVKLEDAIHQPVQRDGEGPAGGIAEEVHPDSERAEAFRQQEQRQRRTSHSVNEDGSHGPEIDTAYNAASCGRAVIARARSASQFTVILKIYRAICHPEAAGAAERA